MLPVGFEPTISAGERPHTYALDRRPLGPAVYLLTVNLTTPVSKSDYITSEFRIVGERSVEKDMVAPGLN